MFTSTSKINYEDKIPRLLGSFLLVMGIVISGCSKTPDETTTNNTNQQIQPVPEQSEQPKMVGRIASINGPVSAYALKRKAQNVKIGFLVFVYEGDEIKITNQEYTLELVLGGHQHVVVTYHNSPYTVKNIGKVPTPQKNATKWAGEELTGYHESRCDPKKMLCDDISVTTRTQTRGNDILMPLLEDNPSQIVAGERPLHLRWFGGESPYQVSIYENGQALTSKLVKDQWLKTQALSLEATKTYQVTITDVNGQTMTETFNVVATMIDFPKVLQEDTSLSPESRQTIWAMELAAQKKGKWMLEAYQQAAEIAGKHYPARLLRDRLEKGLRVRKPK
jgi:hypothetical protein